MHLLSCQQNTGPTTIFLEFSITEHLLEQVGLQALIGNCTLYIFFYGTWDHLLMLSVYQVQSGLLPFTSRLPFPHLFLLPSTYPPLFPRGAATEAAMRRELPGVSTSSR